MTELYVKLIGVAIIILTALYSSYIMISSRRAKFEEISAFAALISHIKENIKYFSKPIPEIMSDYRDKYFRANGFLKSANSSSPREAILEYNFKNYGEEKDIILNFFEKIGEGYIEDEINLCDFTLEKLRSIEQKFKNENKNAEKLYRSIPIIIAMSVILLLI